MRPIIKLEKNRMQDLSAILNRKFILFILLFFILSSYESGGVDRIFLADRVADAFLTNMKKKYKAHCSGYGGGYAQAKIDHISIGLEIKRKFEINEARKLVKEMVEEFIKLNNHDRNVMIYFENQKCSSKNLWLDVAFVDKYNGETNALIVTNGKMISYNIPDGGGYTEIAREDYDQSESSL